MKEITREYTCFERFRKCELELYILGYNLEVVNGAYVRKLIYDDSKNS